MDPTAVLSKLSSSDDLVAGAKLQRRVIDLAEARDADALELFVRSIGADQRGVVLDAAVMDWNPDEPRDETGKWVASGQSVPGSYKGTNEGRMPLAEHQALRQKVRDRFVGAVKAALPPGTELRVAKWQDGGSGWKVLSVGISVEGDRASSAWSVISLDRSGNVYLQQHDTSLDPKLRGQGLGGKMVGALIAGYKALGAGKGDVPIHVDTNPSFWGHMNKQHGGIFSMDALRDWNPEQPVL